jgi:hypothetical protein
VVKDLVLFPLLWLGYAGEEAGWSYSPVGRRGVALARLEPHGTVRVRGEIWRAVAEAGEGVIASGSPVRVTAREGLTLRVRAETGADARDRRAARSRQAPRQGNRRRPADPGPDRP